MLVKETIWNYINGRNNGDSVTLKKAFHADAVLKSVDQKGELVVWPAQEYIKRMGTGKKQDCTAEIVDVKRFNTAAQATVVLTYKNAIFYDYLNMLKVNGTWLITDKIFARMPVKGNVLFVVTSHSDLGTTGKKAGVNLKEVSHVYKTLSDAGYTIDFVSPNGGVAHIYGHDLHDSVNVWFLQQEDAFYKMLTARKPAEINAEKYAGIYFAGGHGTMWDFPNHPKLQEITAKIYESQGVVGALCHGPAGLLNVRLSNGTYLVKGKRISGYTNAEEKDIRLDTVMPFLLETALKERGALFQAAAIGASHYEVDDRLVTGQNPQSAASFARAFLTTLMQQEDRKASASK